MARAAAGQDFEGIAWGTPVEAVPALRSPSVVVHDQVTLFNVLLDASSLALVLAEGRNAHVCSCIPGRASRGDHSLDRFRGSDAKPRGLIAWKPVCTRKETRETTFLSASV